MKWHSQFKHGWCIVNLKELTRIKKSSSSDKPILHFTLESMTLELQCTKQQTTSLTRKSNCTAHIQINCSAH